MTNDHSILDLFHQAQTLYRDQPAFTCLGRTLSYRQLDELSSALAAYLQHHRALQPGDRIAIQLPNLLQYPVAVYGALKAGLVLVNTNPLYTAREMAHQFQDSGAKALIVLKTLVDKANEVIPHTGIETVLVTDPLDLHRPIPHHSDEEFAQAADQPATVNLRAALALGHELRHEPPATTPDDLVVLQYTGGTTGVAKGAMLNHRNLVANTRQMTERSKAYFRRGEEVYAAPLPLYHIYAFSIHCLSLLHKGGHSILIPNPRDLDSFVEALKPFAITGFVGINTLFAALCRHDDFKTLDFSALKSTSSGGMALTAEIAKSWKAITGIDIAEGYGMTEASPVISSNPPGHLQLGTVGLPVADTEVKVVDAEGNSLGPNQIGELCIRGPQVMQGYWQQPEETAQVLSADGWLKTGDIALIQPDGYLRLVDRAKDMIVVSGFNVYPTEVEEVALMHPSVRECAAISMPDQHSGEAVKLFVVPTAPTFETEALRDFMRGKLAAYKIPSQVQLIDELPKSNVGKVLRRELR